MMYDPEKHHRRSIRLKGYDYSHAGAYFVTICTQDKECLFGEVMDGKMRLSEQGKITMKSWEWLSAQYGYVAIDECVVMPNHLHGIVVVMDDCRGGSRTALTETIRQKPLGRLIGAFKTVSSKAINNMRNTPGMLVWQRNYYEHVVRNEESLNRIRQYIMDNPAQWSLDRENPNAIKKEAEDAWLV